MEIEAWFERAFDLTLPPARYPLLLERLRGTPVRLEERLRGAPREVLTRRGSDGEAWSIQRNAGHLLDLEPLWLTRTEELLTGAETLSPADLTNRRTDEADHDTADLTALLGAFRTARAELVARLEAATPDDVVCSALHPRLGTPLRLIDHALFVAEHDDHHLATIGALLRG